MVPAMPRLSGPAGRPANDARQANCKHNVAVVSEISQPKRPQLNDTFMKNTSLTQYLLCALGLWLLSQQCGQCFYDPGLQRWICRDPILEAGGINLYAYVANRVPYRIDPFGLADANGDCPGTPKGMGDNCYQYACGRSGRNSDLVGAGGGQRCTNPQDCDAIKNSAMSDGLSEVPPDGNCPEGTHRVGYARGSGGTQDYHWFRQSNDGDTWCHKFKGLGPSNTDGSGKPITDPADADLHFPRDAGHDDRTFKFCGYLCAPDTK